MTMQTAIGTRAPGDTPTTVETAPDVQATVNAPTTPPTSPSSAPFPNTRPKRSGRRFTLPVIGLLIVAGAAWYGADVYRTDQLYVSTENAQLTGQPVQVGPTSAGRGASLNTAVGGTVPRAMSSRKSSCHRKSVWPRTAHRKWTSLTRRIAGSMWSPPSTGS